TARSVGMLDSPTAGGWEFKIIGFGIARYIHSERTRGLLLGDPEYMSPEQILGLSVDPRSDIYTLGATFYRVVTGEHAISYPQAFDLNDFRAAVLHGERRDLRYWVPAPEKLAGIFRRCLDPDPGR